MAKEKAKVQASDGEEPTPSTGQELALPADRNEPWHTNPTLLVARFPNELGNNSNALAQFVGVCLATGLNPVMGEMVPIHGRPYITEEGWLRLIDERAPGQLIRDEVSLASQEEKESLMGKEAKGWLGKAVVTRLLPLHPNLPPGRNERTTTDWFFYSTAAMESSVIDAVRNEPWRHAMKTAHVRALRKAFRDVVAAAVADQSVVDSDIETEYERLVTMPDEDPETTDRKRFWARAKENGIHNATPELAAIFGLPVYGAGALKEHWLDKGNSWAKANLVLDEYLATGKTLQQNELEEKPETVQQCHYCGKLNPDLMFDEEGAFLFCADNDGECIEGWKAMREGREVKIPTAKTERRQPKRK